MFPLEVLGRRGGSMLLPYLASRGCCIPQLTAPHHIISPSVSIFTSPSLCLLLLPPCGYTGTTQVIQGPLPISASLVTSAQALLPHKAAQSKVPGFRARRHLGHYSANLSPCVSVSALQFCFPSHLTCVYLMFCSSFISYRRKSSLNN